MLLSLSRSGFYCCDLFIDLAKRKADVILVYPPLKIDGQLAPIHPEIFENSSVASPHISVDNTFDGFVILFPRALAGWRQSIEKPAGLSSAGSSEILAVKFRRPRSAKTNTGSLKTIRRLVMRGNYDDDCDGDDQIVYVVVDDLGRNGRICREADIEA